TVSQGSEEVNGRRPCRYAPTRHQRRRPQAARPETFPSESRDLRVAAEAGATFVRASPGNPQWHRKTASAFFQLPRPFLPKKVSQGLPSGGPSVRRGPGEKS